MTNDNEVIQQTITELKTRVINGNQALFDAWKKAKTLPQPQYVKTMNAIDDKFQLLGSLCRGLAAFGYNTCLYSDNRPCFTQDAWFCCTCPKDFNKSLPGLASPAGHSLGTEPATPSPLPKID